MLHRAFLVLVVGVLTTGCRFFETQTSPTNTTPTAVSLSGVVRATGTTAPVKGATIQILDGANKGRVMTTDVKGAYKFDSLEAGNANVVASADGMPETTQGVLHRQRKHARLPARASAMVGNREWAAMCSKCPPGSRASVDANSRERQDPGRRGNVRL